MQVDAVGWLVAASDAQAALLENQLIKLWARGL
jgi:hypothetical protein